MRSFRFCVRRMVPSRSWEGPSTSAKSLAPSVASATSPSAHQASTFWECDHKSSSTNPGTSASRTTPAPTERVSESTASRRRRRAIRPRMAIPCRPSLCWPSDRRFEVRGRCWRRNQRRTPRSARPIRLALGRGAPNSCREGSRSGLRGDARLGSLSPARGNQELQRSYGLSPPISY